MESRCDVCGEMQDGGKPLPKELKKIWGQGIAAACEIHSNLKVAMNCFSIKAKQDDLKRLEKGEQQC